MKVLHLVNTLAAGGAELHLLTLCRHLKRHGLEVVVACLRERVKDGRSLRPDFEQEGIRVINLHGEGRYQWRFLREVLPLLRQERPDILHTHLPRADLAGAIAHLRYPSIPWVCSVHAIYRNTWSGRRMLPVFNWIWRHANTVIAISHAVEDWLVNDGYLPPEKVKVIHYGIDVERFAQANSDRRRDRGLDGHAVIGSIGRLEPNKGHATLIRAMPLVLKEVPNALLLIAGHDPSGYGKTLQALIDHLELNKSVRLVGFQSDVPSFLHTLDVFAFASFSEGFGQVVVEAMAAGKPVVASNIPPLTEIVVDGETGLLAELDNPPAFAKAISWLLTHPKEAQQMGRYGQERVLLKFSSSAMTEKTLSLYQELLKGKI